MPKRHNSETLACIRQLAEQGLSRKQIATRLDMTYCAVQGICDRNGIQSQWRQHNTKAGQIDVVKARLANGDSTSQIAADLGVTRHYLANLCKARGVRKDGAQYRRNPEKAKARELAEAGFSGPAIALIMGKSYRTVSIWCAGIDRSCKQITLPAMKRNPAKAAKVLKDIGYDLAARS